MNFFIGDSFKVLNEKFRITLLLTIIISSIGIYNNKANKKMSYRDKHSIYIISPARGEKQFT